MKVDVATLDCQVAILENAIDRYTATGEVRGPLGARHPSITPFDAFATASGHIIIAAGNNALFAKMCTALGRDDLPSNPLFAENPLRSTHHATTTRRLSRNWKTPPERDRPASGSTSWRPQVFPAVRSTLDKVVADPQVVARNMMVSIDDPNAGYVRMGNPIKLSAFDDPAIRPHAPDLDEHRSAVMKALRRWHQSCFRQYGKACRHAS